MKIIKHRVNTVEELIKTPKKFGVEIDIRTDNNSLILHHDPFCPGVLFDKWLQYFDHDILILNVKEEGLESKIVELMIKYKIENYFFLDQSFPFLIKTTSNGNRRSALRVSEYEPMTNVFVFPFSVDWVWVDCFTLFPLKRNEVELLQNRGFRVCIVSPELQGSPIEGAYKLKEKIQLDGIFVDAVCTKYPEVWG